MNSIAKSLLLFPRRSVFIQPSLQNSVLSRYFSTVENKRPSGRRTKAKETPVNQNNLPQSIETQDDLDLAKTAALDKAQENTISEQLTYSQEYYILHREALLQKRKEKEEEAKFGDYSARLVKRPQKNFLWGYGTKLTDEQREYFRKGELPTIRELIRFLEMYQMKDISVVNLKALGRTHYENYAIVASGFSNKHLYNTAKILCQEVKKLECPEILNIPKVLGRKDDSWLMICIKEVQVHLLLDEYREDLDLEFRWLNEPPQEMINKWKLYEKLKKKSANIDVNDETFKTYQHETPKRE